MRIVCDDESDLTLVNDYNNQELYVEIFNEFNITLLDRTEERRGKDLLVVKYIHKEVGVTNIIAIFTENIDVTIEDIEEDCFEQNYKYEVLFTFRRKDADSNNN